MKQLYLLAAGLLVATAARAQTGSVGIGTTTPNAKAALDISATGKGLLIPRMDSATRAQIATPPDGLMVFQTDGRKGFWYAFGNTWLYIPDKTRSGDNLGNHTATQNLRLNGQWLSNDGGNEGLRVDNGGNVGIGITAPALTLDVSETLGLRNSAAWDHLYFNHDGGSAFVNAGGAESGLALRVGTGSSGSYGGQSYSEIMRLLPSGRVGIGTTTPQQQLHVAGNIAADGPLGLMLAAADRPLVTRGWDAFTSGTYQGIGRWGVFMESNNLTFGVPALSGKQFQWARYNANSTVASTLMTLNQSGNLQLAGSYGYTSAQTRTYNLGAGAFISSDPTTSQTLTLFGSGPIPLGTSLTGSGMGTLLAPLRLPAGATVTSLEVTVYDGDNSTAVTTQARVVGVAGNVGASSADAPTTAWVTVPQGNGVVVQGSGSVSLNTDTNHSYLVEFQGNRSGVLALLTVRVGYTVTQAE